MAPVGVEVTVLAARLMPKQLMLPEVQVARVWFVALLNVFVPEAKLPELELVVV
jgi:hypothetical protein